MTISKDEDQAVREDPESDGRECGDERVADDERELADEGDERSASPVVKWGMAGLLLVYAGTGSYWMASALGHKAEDLSREIPGSVAASLASPATNGTGTPNAGTPQTAGMDAFAIAEAKTRAGISYAARVAASVQAAEQAPMAQVLTAVSATAVGPQGAADGDHPQLAGHVLDPRTGTSWVTQWYASARFGNLKGGTGLLLDMGRVVMIREIQLSLAGTPGLWGADVEIRVGDTPSLGGVQPAAVAHDVGGWVSPHVRSPVGGRYIQIWFTKLPRDPSGTYQEHVYGITIRGSASEPSGETARPGTSGATARHPSGHGSRAGHARHRGGSDHGHGGTPHRGNGRPGHGAPDGDGTYGAGGDHR